MFGFDATIAKFYDKTLETDGVYVLNIDKNSPIYKAGVREGDIVAILGKGAENYQEINGVKYHYSDYEVVDEFFKHKQEREIQL